MTKVGERPCLPRPTVEDVEGSHVVIEFTGRAYGLCEGLVFLGILEVLRSSQVAGMKLVS